MLHAPIKQHHAEILALADRHCIRDARVFGYMARDDGDDANDIDLSHEPVRSTCNGQERNRGRA